MKQIKNDDEIKLELESAIAILKLKDLDIEEIVVEFSGSGDSGDIDEINYNTINGNSIDVDDLIHTKIENLAWKILQKIDSVGDWVNNEGGFGTLYIYTEKSTFTLEYHQRTTEEHNWEDCGLFN
jgi:hypothetical protein